MDGVGSGFARRAVVLLRHLVVWAVAMVVGTTGAYPVLAMGLVVPGPVIVPLSYCAGAALMVIAASWVGTALDWGRTRGHLGPILRVGISTALIISVVDVVARVAGGNLVAISTAGVLLLAMAVIALNVSIATWRFREAGRNLRRDALLAVVLLGLTLGVVVAAIYSTCNLWYCSG